MTERVSRGGGGETVAGQAAAPGSQAARQSTGRYRGAQGLDPEFIKELEKQFGFDKPLWERFVTMIGKYIVFDFGESYFRNRPVVDLVLEKMPVSISLGLWTTLITYLISIPLGVAKAVRDGSRFDVWTSVVIVVGNAVPAFLFAVLLLVLFAGGSYVQWFPLRGLVSENWADLSWPAAHPRLFLASGAAGDGDGDRRLRHADDADEELVSRSDQSAVRADRPRQGPVRAPRALRPRLPQRHADRHRRISRRAGQHPVHRHRLHRDHLLARRARSARTSRRRSPATIR